MNISVYLFGEFSVGYSQYPNDYAKIIFESFAKSAQATTQISIHRDGDLMYYGYIRKMENAEYLGLCVVVNGKYITQLDGMFAIYEQVIESMVRNGYLIHYGDKGEITSKVGQLYENREEIDLITSNLQAAFDRLEGSSKKLPAVNYGVAKNSVKSFSIQDDGQEIIKSSYTNGYTFIYKSKGYNTAQMNSYKGVVARIVALVLFGIVYVKVINPSEVTKKDMGAYVYYGPMENGEPNGTGVAIYHKNDKDGRLYYYGNFNDGKRIDNNAIMFYKDGSYFKGSMNEDKWYKGLFFDVEKAHFIGEFKDNKPWNGDWYKHVKEQTIVDGE